MNRYPVGFCAKEGIDAVRTGISDSLSWVVHKIFFLLWLVLVLPFVLFSERTWSIGKILGLPRSFPLYVSVKAETFMLSPPDPKLGDRLEIAQSDDPTSPLQNVVFRRAFVVPWWRMRGGCHGDYSLAETLYYLRVHGKDPICAGSFDLKYHPSKRAVARQVARLMCDLERGNKFAWLTHEKNYGKPVTVIWFGDGTDIGRVLSLGKPDDFVPVMQPVNVTLK